MMLVTVPAIVLAMVVLVAIVMMPVAVTVHGASTVGATFGIERAFNGAHGRAEAAHHLRDHMVLADVDGAIAKLCCEMAVAEVPGDTRQRPLVLADNLEQALRSGLDRDDAAVLQPDTIAGREHRRLGKIKQE
jgi:hypothetical protein